MKYLQVNQDNLITDCISYPFQNYIEFDGEVPQSVMGGWHKLENGVIVEYLELKPKTETEVISDLKMRIDGAESAIVGLMFPM